MVADLQECCETTGVASIDTFWLATAAAAPVIALAAVVVLPDTSGMYRDDVQPVIDEWFDSPANFQAAMRTAGASEWVVEAVSAINLADAKEKVVRAKATRSLRVLVASIRWTAIGNVLLQAVLLALSLAALAYNVHVMPPWLAIVLPVGRHCASGHYGVAGVQLPPCGQSVPGDARKGVLTDLQRGAVGGQQDRPGRGRVAGAFE